MELRKHFNYRVFFIIIYCLAFLSYLIIGLQSVDASSYSINGKLEIPFIGLDTDVTELTLNNRELETPDTIVGSFSNNKNKTLLIGHSTGVFADLYKVKLDEVIKYNSSDYHIKRISIIDEKYIDMNEILKEEENDTLVLMTCAGRIYNDGSATHRLIIVATR